MRQGEYLQRCPEATTALLEELETRRLLLVGSNGPTSFKVADEDSRTFRVLIGAAQSCSACGNCVCIHVLFVMVKVLQVPKDHSLVWQTSLIDAELESVLNFRYRQIQERKMRHKPRKKRGEEGLVSIGRVDDDDDELCPVCLDFVRVGVVTFCAKSCGKFCHVSCMLEYATHNGSVKCPFCRESWGDTQEVVAALRKIAPAEKPGTRGSQVHSVTCENCLARPVRGERNLHTPRHHVFLKKHRVGDDWVAPTEEDVGAFLARHVVHQANCSEGVCVNCGENATSLLNCGHSAHRDCIAARLNENLSFACPVCRQLVVPGLAPKRVLKTTTFRRTRMDKLSMRAGSKIPPDLFIRNSRTSFPSATSAPLVVPEVNASLSSNPITRQNSDPVSSALSTFSLLSMERRVGDQHQIRRPRRQRRRLISKNVPRMRALRSTAAAATFPGESSQRDELFTTASNSISR